MSELERELRALGAAVAFPPTPDLASLVARDLEPRPTRMWPRRLALAAVVAAVAIGAAFAVPPARTAILRFFGIGAVRIEFVDRLPEVRRAPLDLGTRIDGDEAPFPVKAPFPVLRSKLLGKPDAIYLNGDVVTQLYGTPSRIRLLVTEIVGSGFESSVGKKLLGEGTRVRFVAVPGATGPGVWVEGKPHIVDFPGGPARLAKNTLIWQRGELTVRLEGAIRLGQASRIADSLR